MAEEQTTEQSYDQVPYPVLSHSRTHPDRLATVATLLGMHPAPVEECRVLELGCAGGGNLIPMAGELLNSRFVGIDVSGRQIAEGQRAVAELGLGNVTLRRMDLLDVGSDLGEFDYIIAHGVFSWVERPVQEKVLAICRQHLADQGVAYVSYNTYPGWHMLNVTRDIMRFHTRSVDDPLERASRGRRVLDLVVRSAAHENSAYSSFLSTYADYLDGDTENANCKEDAALLHDELAAVNEPFYFHAFVERAAQHGLQYLGEADFRTMVGSNLPPEVNQALDEMASSVIEYEQYMDFVKNRTFRRTLLCHQDAAVDRKLKIERLRGLAVSSGARPEDGSPDGVPAGVERFRGSDGAVFTTDHRVTREALHFLTGRWPQAVPFPALLSAARASLGLNGRGDGDDERVLATNLLTAFGYSDKLVDLHVYVPRLVLQASRRPVAAPWVRWLARDNTRVTNRCHERVKVDGLDRYLLRHLDGDHDVAALVDRLMSGPVADGHLVIGNAKRSGDEEKRAILTGEVEKRLEWLARAALLVG